MYLNEHGVVIAWLCKAACGAAPVVISVNMEPSSLPRRLYANEEAFSQLTLMSLICEGAVAKSTCSHAVAEVPDDQRVEGSPSTALDAA
jgi:hypothetical protein